MVSPLQPDRYKKTERVGNKLAVHLHSGAKIETWDERFEEPEDVRDHITEPPKPHWSIIGDVVVFTQAIAAVELL